MNKGNYFTDHNEQFVVRKIREMKGIFYGLALVVIFFLTASLDNQELEVQEKLAAEYAEMLKAEQACQDWACISELNN